MNTPCHTYIVPRKLSDILEMGKQIMARFGYVLPTFMLQKHGILLPAIVTKETLNPNDAAEFIRTLNKWIRYKDPDHVFLLCQLNMELVAGDKKKNVGEISSLFVIKYYPLGGSKNTGTRIITVKNKIQFEDFKLEMKSTTPRSDEPDVIAWRPELLDKRVVPQWRSALGG